MVWKITPEQRMPYLLVCLQHGGLYDDHPFEKDGITQLCHGRERQKRWEGPEVGEWIRLCDCCLVETVRQGSRFSPFFCKGCAHRLHEARRRYGIPFGRHSVMNGISMPPLGVEGFADAANGMFSRIEHLERWKAERVRQVYDGREDPQLDEFVEQATRYSESAVFELVDWWRGEVLGLGWWN